jgi:hypothetical protein
VFNMDGAGADGNPTPRFAAYGATKRSLQQVGSSSRCVSCTDTSAGAMCFTLPTARQQSSCCAELLWSNSREL